MAEKRTLKLTLKRKFFDAIHAGEKTTEFRDCKPHWISRLLIAKDDGNYDVRPYDTILFRNGYNPDSPTMEVEWKGTFIQEYADAPENGTDEERLYFAIDLGKVLNTANYEG